MASGSSGSGSGTPLGITLPDWMKRKTPDRYAFDETPFSPPSPSDEYFLIKYPYKEPEKKSSYETINSLTAAGVRSSSLSSATTRRESGSADALGPATKSPTNSSNLTAGGATTLSPADAKEAKVRRNSAVTVLPSGQVSIKTYGDPTAPNLKKSSDPSTYYGDYANHFRKTIADEEMQVAVSSGDLMDEGAYDSDASVSSNPNPGANMGRSVPSSANATPPAAAGVGGGSSVSGHLTSSILGALGHHLTDLATGGHGIMDYFHQHEEHDAPVPASSFGGSATGSPLTSQPGTPSDVFPKTSSNVERKGVRADKHRRIGLGSFPAPSNPFFAADGSTMSMFSGLYQKESEMTTSASSPGALVQQGDPLQHQQSVALAQQPGSVVPNLVGAVAANRSSSAYDSQLAMGGHGLSDVEMEAVARVADNARNRRWVPKPSKQREMNLFAPCST